MKQARAPSSTKLDEFSYLPVQPITLTHISCGGTAKTASRSEWIEEHLQRPCNDNSALKDQGSFLKNANRCSAFKACIKASERAHAAGVVRSPFSPIVDLIDEALLFRNESHLF